MKGEMVNKHVKQCCIELQQSARFWYEDGAKWLEYAASAWDGHTTRLDYQEYARDSQEYSAQQYAKARAMLTD